MKRIRNVVFVSTEEAYLSLDGEALVLLKDNEAIGRLPLHNVEAIFCFNYAGASPKLMYKCAELNVRLAFFTPQGKFLAQSCGPTHGNVYVRKAQYEAHLDSAESLSIAKTIIACKIYNQRWLLERYKRDYKERLPIRELEAAIDKLKTATKEAMKVRNAAELRGVEGNAADVYFSQFAACILSHAEHYEFRGRSKRPAMDPINAVLNLVYALIRNETMGALESVGLDPYFGFLHVLRPGRPSLALDLMEEFRGAVADRFVLSIINLKQIGPSDVLTEENGTALITEEGRKKITKIWSEKRQGFITHPFLKEKIQWGQVPLVQAMLLAKYLRKEIDAYPPFFWKG